MSVGMPPKGVQTGQKPGVTALDPTIDKTQTGSTEAATDQFGVGGAQGYLSLDDAQATKAMSATLAGAASLLKLSETTIARLPVGADLDRARIATFNKVLGQLAKVSKDLSVRGLGSTSADAGRAGDLRGIAEQLGAQYVALEGKLAGTKNGEIHKASSMVGDLVRGQLEAADVAGNLAAKVNLQLEASGVTGAITGELQPESEQFKRTAWAHYNKGKQATTHFMKVIHFGRADTGLDRVRASDGDPATLALADNRGGMIKHQWGDDPAAIALYDRARARLGGSYAPADYNSAVSHAALGNTEEAVALLNDAISHTPNADAQSKLREIAAGDSDLTPLLSSLAYHQLVEPAGGTKLTKTGEADHRGRDLHQTPAWSYDLPVVGLREYLDEQIAAMGARLRDEKKSNISIHWDGDKAEIIAETVPVPGAMADKVLAEISLGTGHYDVTVHATDKLVFDPAELHRLFGDMKLRDTML